MVSGPLLAEQEEEDGGQEAPGEGERMNELIGKKLSGILVNEDATVLVFETDGGPVAYEAEGDCCSQSWFADITGIGNVLGYVVRAVEEVELPDYNVDDGRGRDEEDAVYGYRIRTDGGVMDVVFRNSSNGYYGGWLNYRAEFSLEGMICIEGQEWRSEAQWRQPIT